MLKFPFLQLQTSKEASRKKPKPRRASLARRIFMQKFEKKCKKIFGLDIYNAKMLKWKKSIFLKKPPNLIGGLISFITQDQKVIIVVYE